MFSARNFVEKNERKITLLARFLVAFNLLALPMYAVILSGTQLPILQSIVASIVDAVLNAMSYSTSLSGMVIRVASPVAVDVAIDADCTGWKSMYAYAALVLATPLAMGWRKRTKLVVIGMSALFVLNIARIVSTVAAASVFGVAVLDVVHTVLWREGMIIAVVLLWFAVVRKFKKSSQS